MAFYGYKGDADKYYWTPCNSDYDYDFAPTPIQASSPYEFGEPESMEYNSSAYYKDDSFVTPSELNYTVCTYSEPKILQYEPIEYHSSYNYHEFSVNPSELKYSIYSYSEPKLLQYEPPSYFPSETKFTVSYSTAEFNEPEFEEYDPTPYGGGYDPVSAYGKPLPPSDITCYPRSVPQPDSKSLENFSYGSTPSPYGKDDDLPTKPPKPVDSKPEAETHVENGHKVTGDGADGEIVEPVDDDSPSYEHENGFEDGIRGGYGYQSERQVTQIPYGSGLEAMDLCECIFGYWPCLAKIEQQRKDKCSQVCDQQRRMDPWESAADYLFGSPVVYHYENYHQQQQIAQYEYYDNSLLH